MDKLHIVGISGSLRKGSYNTALLRALAGLVPADAEVGIADISTLPLYNQDVESAGLPQAVVDFKQKIKSANGILFVTPEYNYSVPGVLKNAIDWGSRPYGDNSFDNKPVAVASVSPGLLGGMRAQYHLRQSFVYLNMHALNKPEVMVAGAQKKFDEQGNLVDEETKKYLAEFLAAFVAWIRRLNPQ